MPLNTLQLKQGWVAWQVAAPSPWGEAGWAASIYRPQVGNGGKKPQAEWKRGKHGQETRSFASPQHPDLFPSSSRPCAGGLVLHVPI